MLNPFEYAERIAYSSKKVLRFTHEMAVKFKDSPGVYVECGCAAGAQIIAMHKGAPDKFIYAFDSFEGIPLPSNRDDQMPGIARLSKTEQLMLPDPGKQVLETSGATVVPLWAFMEHMRLAGVDVDKIVVVPGWFENTIPFYQDGMPDVSILRLDGDLYNSTWVCLQHLFEKVIKGGCVIIDDWSLPGCQAACKEYFDLIGYEPNYQYLDGTAYFFK